MAAPMDKSQASGVLDLDEALKSQANHLCHSYRASPLRFNTPHFIICLLLPWLVQYPSCAHEANFPALSASRLLREKRRCLYESDEEAAGILKNSKQLNDSCVCLNALCANVM